MRHVQPRLRDCQVVNEQNVEVERARRIALSGHARAPGVLLDPLQRGEQCLRRQPGVEADHRIEVIGAAVRRRRPAPTHKSTIRR
jgi:hypothetical protein